MENKNKTILIVDDDIDALTLTEMHVKSFGFDVILAESQKDAEKILEETKPDLAIYDLMMENKDSGFILSYKTKQKYPGTPIIIATNVTAETGMIFGLETKQEKSWIKADAYIEKSVRPDQLKREINKLLKV